MEGLRNNRSLHLFMCAGVILLCFGHVCLGVLHKLSLETVLFSMALSKDRQKQKVVSRYLTELRKVKTILKGDDLKNLGIQPGPLYSKILTMLLEERLRGHLKSREDEEKFVRVNAMRDGIPHCSTQG